MTKHRYFPGGMMRNAGMIRRFRPSVVCRYPNKNGPAFFRRALNA